MTQEQYEKLLNIVSVTFVMVAVLILGGIQMTMLGVIGEYLWRTLEAARRQPLYSLEEVVDGAEAKDEAYDGAR